MFYKCEGPDCDFHTKHRNNIEKHHIIPKENGGKNISSNLIMLCPNCHGKIFIDNASLSSKHHIKTENYIILNRILPSTNGLVLEYEDYMGTKYCSLDTWRDSYMDRLKIYGN